MTIHGYWLGGYTSDQVVEKIQGDGALRAQLASADVIVFEVPVGEFRFECPFDNAEWHPLPGTPTEWWTCTARAAARNTANAGRIMDAIVALRSPADALILASNLWEIGYRANLAQGIEPLFPFGHGLGYTTPATGSPSPTPGPPSWDPTARPTRSRPATSSRTCRT